MPTPELKTLLEETVGALSTSSSLPIEDTLSEDLFEILSKLDVLRNAIVTKIKSTLVEPKPPFLEGDLTDDSVLLESLKYNDLRNEVLRVSIHINTIQKTHSLIRRRTCINQALLSLRKVCEGLTALNS